MGQVSPLPPPTIPHPPAFLCASALSPSPSHLLPPLCCFPLPSSSPLPLPLPSCFLSRTQMYERGLEKTQRYVELTQQHRLTDTNDLVWFRTAIDENLPIGLHHSMFIPTLEGQLTEAQQATWLPLARSYAIIGTYAQTEIAHGSFVRGLQTTATFDEASDSFELHTPALSAIKWWPGNLGKTANVIILMARLLIKGKDFGIHPFIVPIRDLDTHQPLPGVTVGDLGPKYAYEMNDNGFLRLDHVRIPRTHMCMRFASLSPKGEYRPSINAKLSYGTMVFVRSWIVIEASRYLARALTVAVRYSAVRLQFPKEVDADEGEAAGAGKRGGKGGVREEAQVLDYTTQQQQLFPLLATAFAFHFTGAYMKKVHHPNLLCPRPTARPLTPSSTDLLCCPLSSLSCTTPT